MGRLKWLLAVSLFIFNCELAHAINGRTIRVPGKVLGFDENSIQLEQSGQRVKIARKFVVGTPKLTFGKTVELEVKRDILGESKNTTSKNRSVSGQ